MPRGVNLFVADDFVYVTYVAHRKIRQATEDSRRIADLITNFTLDNTLERI